VKELLNSIIDAPFDDAPRLIFANWLQEQGDELRSRFIREQIAHYDPARLGGSALEYRGRVNTLCDRRVWAQWDASRWSYYDGSIHVHNSGRSKVVFRRGFPSLVYTTLAEFLRFAAKIFSSHPVTSVWLEDRQPDLVGLSWNMPVTVWHCSEEDGDIRCAHSILPIPIYHQVIKQPGLLRLVWDGTLAEFETEELAYKALSNGLVNWGRSLVGLPMLDTFSVEAAV
jgi:uncharacterized protein (TIGR02996 family)